MESIKKGVFSLKIFIIFFTFLFFLVSLFLFLLSDLLIIMLNYIPYFIIVFKIWNG